MSIALFLCLAESYRRVLLFQRDLSFIFLGDFLVLSSRVPSWRFFGDHRFLMLSECFLYSDALKLCFALGFFALDSVMLREMLDILRVVVRLIGLRFRGVVELLLSKSHEKVRKTCNCATPYAPSWWRKNSVDGKNQIGAGAMALDTHHSPHRSGVPLRQGCQS